MTFMNASVTRSCQAHAASTTRSRSARRPRSRRRTPRAPCVGGDRERGPQRAARRGRVELARSRRRSRRGRVAGGAARRSPGCVAGPGARPRGARAAASARARRRRAGASSSRRFVEAIAVWPSRRQRISTLVSSTAVACVGAERAKRDISERSRDDGDLRRRRPRERERALGDLERASARHATPTSTSRKRAGAAPCETRMTWPGSPLPQLRSPRSRHAGGRADGVEASPRTAASRPRRSGLRSSRPSSPPRISRATSVANWKCRRRSSIDHERLVSRYRPSSVSAIEVGERAGVAGLDRDVRHAHDRLAREAVGAGAAAGALEADRRRRLAVGQRGAQDAAPRSAACASPATPSSSQPNEPRPPGSVASAVMCSCSEP